MNHYSIAGWTVVSDIDLPALPISPRPADIHVEIVGKRPRVAEPLLEGSCWTVGAREWMLWTLSGQTIYVRDGHRISLWSDTDDLRHNLVHTLPGAAFAAVAYMNGRTPFHGAAVSMGSGAVMVLGESGAGKSTFAVALHARGHAVLADDLCLPTRVNDTAQVQPVFPQLRSFPHVLDHFHLEGEALPDGKRRLPLPIGLTEAAVPLRAMIVLQNRKAHGGHLRRITGSDALQLIMGQRWAPQCTAWYGVEERSFRDCAWIAKHVAIFAANVPDGLDRLPDYCLELERRIAELPV